MWQPERSMPIPIKRIWFNAEKTNGEHFKMIHTVENTQMHNNKQCKHTNYNYSIKWIQG